MFFCSLQFILEGSSNNGGFAVDDIKVRKGDTRGRSCELRPGYQESGRSQALTRNMLMQRLFRRRSGG